MPSQLAFTTSIVTDSNGRLRIKFTSVDDFYFDIVTLVPVTAAAGVASESATAEERVFLPVVANQAQADATESQQDEGQVQAAVADGTTVTIRKYYYFGGQRVAMATNDPDLASFRYLHWDHLGSTVMETNPDTGNVFHVQSYYAYGKYREVDNDPNKEDKVITDHKFTGQKLDGAGLM